jgi:hypothetical protein
MESVKSGTDLSAQKEYLTLRGFPTDAKTISQAKIEFSGSQRCREVLGLKEDKNDKRTGIIFHYPSDAGVSDEPYAVVRWFGRYVGPFGSVADMKIQNPAGRTPPVYMSPLNDWTKYGDEQTLWICESALKSLVVSLSGRYAISGSGVWGLCPDKKLADGFPDSYMEHTAKVCIIYDNDWRRNPNVRHAIRRLGSLLKDRWPHLDVKHAVIPDPPTATAYHDAARGKHSGIWGVDDAFHHFGVSLYELLELADIEAGPREAVLDALNEQYAICLNPFRIIDTNISAMYGTGEFVNGVAANKNYTNDSGKLVSGAKEWMKSETRRTVSTIVYKPGQGQIHEGNYNLWRDDGVPAESGDIGPFLRVYENAIPDPITRTLLFQCLGYILQHRGTKLDKMLVFVGREVGTGKSLLANIMGMCVGRSNSAFIMMDSIEGSFNSAFAAKEWVVLDDLHKLGKREMAKLKTYTTSDRIMVNTKGVAEYEVDNHAVFVITTNEYGSLAMDDVERRNLIIEFTPTVHYPTGTNWWRDFHAWLESGGYAAVRAWLEQMDLTGFDPGFMPPMTDAKSHMIDMGMSEVEQIAYDLYNDPDSILGVPAEGGNGRSVWRADELWLLATGREFPDGVNRAFGRALGNKFKQVSSNVKRYFPGQPPCRVWIIRNRDEEWSVERAQEDIKRFAKKWQ